MKRFVNVFLFSLCLVSAFISCKNFNQGSDLSEAIKESIDYVNSPLLNIKLYVENEKMGTIEPSGNVTSKKGDHFSITFTKTDYCDFSKEGFKCNCDAITFSNVKISGNTCTATATVVQDQTDLISITPAYTEKFYTTKSFPDNPKITYPSNTQLELSFNYPVEDKDLFKTQFKITYNDQNFFPEYYDIIWSSDSKSVTLIPLADKLINYIENEALTILNLSCSFGNNFSTTMQGKESIFLPDSNSNFSFSIIAAKSSIKPQIDKDSFEVRRKYDNSYNKTEDEKDKSLLDLTEDKLEFPIKNHIKNIIKFKGKITDGDNDIYGLLIRETLVNYTNSSPTGFSETDNWNFFDNRNTDFEFEYTLKTAENGRVKIDIAPKDYSGNTGDIISFYVIKDYYTDLLLSVKNYNLDSSLNNTPTFPKDKLEILNSIILQDENLTKRYDASKKLEDYSFFNISVSTGAEVTHNGEEKGYWEFPYTEDVSDFTITVEDKIGNIVKKTFTLPPKPIFDGYSVNAGIDIDGYISCSDTMITSTDFRAWDNKNPYSFFIPNKPENYEGPFNIRTIKDGLFSKESDIITIYPNASTFNYNESTQYELKVSYKPVEPESLEVTYTLENADEIWANENTKNVWIFNPNGSSREKIMFNKNESSITLTVSSQTDMWTQQTKVVLYVQKSYFEVDTQSFTFPAINTLPDHTKLDNYPPKPKSFSLLHLENLNAENDYGNYYLPFEQCKDNQTGIKSCYFWSTNYPEKTNGLNYLFRGIQNISYYLRIPTYELEPEENGYAQVYLEITDNNDNKATVYSAVKIVDIPQIGLDTIGLGPVSSTLHLASSGYGNRLYQKEIFIFKLVNNKWELFKTINNNDINESDPYIDPDDPKMANLYIYDADTTLDNNCAYKVYTKAKLLRNSIDDRDYGYSTPEYFVTADYSSGESPSGDYILSGDDGILIHSDKPVFVHTVVTKRPYSECKNWQYYDWEHNNKKQNETLLEFTENSSAKKYSYDNIEAGKYFVGIVYFSNGIVQMTPIKIR